MKSTHLFMSTLIAALLSFSTTASATTPAPGAEARAQKIEQMKQQRQATQEKVLAKRQENRQEVQAQRQEHRAERIELKKENRAEVKAIISEGKGLKK